MKKIISFLICTILCTVFSIGAFALYEQSPYPISVNFGRVPSSYDDIPAFVTSYNSQNELNNTPYYIYFAGDHSGDVTWYYLLRFTSDNLVYNEDTQTLSKADGSSFDFYYGNVAVEDGQDNLSGSSAQTVRTTSIKFNGNIDTDRLVKHSNMHIKNLEKFNALAPPDVFTYNINPSPFTLENYNGDKGILEVRISYTADYLAWVDEFHKVYPDVSCAYSFIVYISPQFANDTSSLAKSLNQVSYIKLFYGEYVYEGGIGYPYLSEENTNAYMSQSGKSPYTDAQGVHICCTLDPLKNSELVVPIKTENIIGSNDHMDAYVYVFGAYSDGNVEPNVFNNKVLEGALSGHTTPNDTYSEYYDENSTSEVVDDDEPLYSFHTYFMPFDFVYGAKGDLYQGNCTYKEQTINGKSYHSGGTVSDFTNKKITPDVIHDVDMDDGEWVKYEDYPKWQDDYYNRKKYTSEFDFDIHNLKDIFDKESNFFEFMTVCLKVLPGFFINIFWGFLVALFAIIILKRLI